MKYFITPVLLVFFIISYIFGARKKHFNFALKELDYTQSFHSFVFSPKTRGKLIEELINKQEIKVIGCKEESSTAEITQKERARVLKEVYQYFNLYHCSVFFAVMLMWITCITSLGAAGDFIFNIIDFESVLAISVMLLGIVSIMAMLFVIAIGGAFSDNDTDNNDQFSDKAFMEIENRLANALQNEWDTEQKELFLKAERLRQRKLEKESELLNEARETQIECTKKSREIKSLINRSQSTITE